MGLTTNRNEPCINEILPGGQQKCYLVLSDEERAKGFIRPVRRTYRHLRCGTTTSMGQAIAETYARNPKFYGGTFCCFCGTHYPLKDDGIPAFLWVDDEEPVGSNEEEAAAWNADKDRVRKEKEQARNNLNVGTGI